MKNYFIILSVITIFSFISNDSFADSDENIIELEKHTMKMINASNYQQALFYLDEILEIEPNNTNALNNKGGVLINTGNYSEAITFFDSVLMINENNTEALNNKAIALYKQDFFVESLHTFYQSLLADSTNQDTIDNTRNVVEQLYWIDETENSFGIITVRDKNGDLVTYSKISKISIQPPLGYIFLENEGNVKEIEIDGKNTKVIEYTDKIILDRTQLVATSGLHLSIEHFKIKVVELLLNGFVGNFDDTIEYTLIIVDPSF